MRLIDADALPEYTGYALSANEVAMAVEDAPTIDAVEVVRCHDCKWYKTMFCKMDRWTDLVTIYVAKANDYCSYGKRKEDE